MADAAVINRARIGVSDFDLRHKISRIFADLVRFAVDSAVDSSRLLIPGKKQAHKPAKEALMDIPLSTPLEAKKTADLSVANDIQLLKMEEMEKDMNNLKRQYKTSTKLVDGSGPLKKPSDDDLKEIDIPKKNGRRLFIRSRL